MKVIKEDAINPRGQRNVADGAVALLEGFEFNKHAGLTKTFGAPFTASIDRATGTMAIDIPSFRPADLISAPRGATHFRLKAVGATIDFDGDTCSVATSGSAYFPIGQEVQGPLRLSHTVAPASVNPSFLVFGIEFMQFVNGVPCPMTNGSFNAMAIVRAEGSHRAELNTDEHDAEEPKEIPLMINKSSIYSKLKNSRSLFRRRHRATQNNALAMESRAGTRMSGTKPFHEELPALRHLINPAAHDARLTHNRMSGTTDNENSIDILSEEWPGESAANIVDDRHDKKKMDNLKVIWNELTSRYTDDDALVDELWTEIVNAYTTKKRHYHNLTHLEYMIDRAIKYRHKLADFDVVILSIFYHDIVYNTKRQDNEQKSADIAHERLTRLGVPPSKIAKCKEQIIATRDHKDNVDSDTNYLVDFDLAILGDSPETYKDYSKKIRDEYSFYPDFLYRNGRKKVLRHFLDMDRIFKTDVFRDSYEQQARKNLVAELRGLS